MSNQIIKAALLVKKAIQEIEKELDCNRSRSNSDASLKLNVRQLEEFKQNLMNILSLIETNCIPPKEQRQIWMGRIIADSWPQNVPLGDTVILAEREYKNL